MKKMASIYLIDPHYCLVLFKSGEIFCNVADFFRLVNSSKTIYKKFGKKFIIEQCDKKPVY